MAKRFSIAQNTTFKHVAQIPRVGDKPISVQLEYKYFPRPKLNEITDVWSKKHSEMVDEWNREREAGTLELVKMNRDETEFDISRLKDILVGWEFDEEFNDENIKALVESNIGTVDAVISAYNEAYQKAKLGN